METTTIIKDYEEGNLTLIEAFTKLREFKSKLEEEIEIIKSFESENINEIELEINENQKQYKGYVFEIRSGRKTYDFSEIQDIVDAKNNVKNLENKYKLAFLSYQQGNVQVDDDTGEVLKIPVMKQGKSSIVMKKKNK